MWTQKEEIKQKFFTLYTVEQNEQNCFPQERVLTHKILTQTLEESQKDGKEYHSLVLPNFIHNDDGRRTTK